jgi:predicted RNA-binding Zn-ribbon protein involved in translation (DUF1610 family)
MIQKSPSVRLSTVSIFSKVFNCVFSRLQRQSNVQVAIGHAAFCEFRFAAFCRVRLDGCSVMPAPSKQALLPANRRFSLTLSGNLLPMSGSLSTTFDCPNCGAKYEIVRVEAPPGLTTNRELVCLSCGDPLHGREGKFILKYFLVERWLRARPR